MPKRIFFKCKFNHITKSLIGDNECPLCRLLCQSSRAGKPTEIEFEEILPGKWWNNEEGEISE